MEREVQYLTELVREELHMHSREIAIFLKTQGVAEIGTRRVQQVLQKNGLFEKETISQISKSKKQRLEFLRRFINAMSIKSYGQKKPK